MKTKKKLLIVLAVCMLFSLMFGTLFACSDGDKLTVSEFEVAETAQAQLNSYYTVPSVTATMSDGSQIAAEVTVYDSSQAEVSVVSNRFYVSDANGYTIVYRVISAGETLAEKRTALSVVDTAAPTLDILLPANKVVQIGDTYVIDESKISVPSGVALSYSVAHEGDTVDFNETEKSFVVSAEGRYDITVTASKGELTTSEVYTVYGVNRSDDVLADFEYETDLAYFQSRGGDYDVEISRNTDPQFAHSGEGSMKVVSTGNNYPTVLFASDSNLDIAAGRVLSMWLYVDVPDGYEYAGQFFLCFNYGGTATRIPGIDGYNNTALGEWVQYKITFSEQYLSVSAINFYMAVQGTSVTPVSPQVSLYIDDIRMEPYSDVDTNYSLDVPSTVVVPAGTQTYDFSQIEIVDETGASAGDDVTVRYTVQDQNGNLIPAPNNVFTFGDDDLYDVFAKIDSGADTERHYFRLLRYSAQAVDDAASEYVYAYLGRAENADELALFESTETLAYASSSHSGYTNIAVNNYGEKPYAMQLANMDWSALDLTLTLLSDAGIPTDMARTLSFDVYIPCGGWVTSTYKIEVIRADGSSEVVAESTGSSWGPDGTIRIQLDAGESLAGLQIRFTTADSSYFYINDFVVSVPGRVVTGFNVPSAVQAVQGTVYTVPEYTAVVGGETDVEAEFTVYDSLGEVVEDAADGSFTVTDVGGYTVVYQIVVENSVLAEKTMELYVREDADVLADFEYEWETQFFTAGRPDAAGYEGTIIYNTDAAYVHGGSGSLKFVSQNNNYPRLVFTGIGGEDIAPGSVISLWVRLEAASGYADASNVFACYGYGSEVRFIGKGAVHSGLGQWYELEITVTENTPISNLYFYLALDVSPSAPVSSESVALYIDDITVTPAGEIVAEFEVPETAETVVAGTPYTIPSFSATMADDSTIVAAVTVYDSQNQPVTPENNQFTPADLNGYTLVYQVIVDGEVLAEKSMKLPVRDVAAPMVELEIESGRFVSIADPYTIDEDLILVDGAPLSEAEGVTVSYAVAFGGDSVDVDSGAKSFDMHAAGEYVVTVVVTRGGKSSTPVSFTVYGKDTSVINGAIQYGLDAEYDLNLFEVSVPVTFGATYTGHPGLTKAWNAGTDFTVKFTEDLGIDFSQGATVTFNTYVLGGGDLEGYTVALQKAGEQEQILYSHTGMVPYLEKILSFEIPAGGSITDYTLHITMNVIVWQLYNIRINVNTQYELSGADETVLADSASFDLSAAGVTVIDKSTEQEAQNVTVTYAVTDASGTACAVEGTTVTLDENGLYTVYVNIQGGGVSETYTYTLYKYVAPTQDNTTYTYALLGTEANRDEMNLFSSTAALAYGSSSYNGFTDIVVNNYGEKPYALQLANMNWSALDLTLTLLSDAGMPTDMARTLSFDVYIPCGGWATSTYKIEVIRADGSSEVVAESTGGSWGANGTIRIQLDAGESLAGLQIRFTTADSSYFYINDFVVTVQ